MDEVGIILLTLFLFLLILGPLYRPICITYARVKDHRKFHPRTSQFKDARRKLSTVSECTIIGREKLDIESNLKQHDTGPECGGNRRRVCFLYSEFAVTDSFAAGSPICIGPLFVSSNGNATSEGPMQAGPSQPSGSGGDGGVLEGSGGQTQSGIGAIRKKFAESRWRARAIQLWKGDTHDTPPDDLPNDDILTLKNCQHAFHAKCLSSWFLIERYDCPVCRSQYWQTREMKTRAAGPPDGIARPPPARITAERLAVPII
ncbi:hypothetical protein CSOJ01_06649 [Colletotrichum sojae]|uniref:RING-type domain-containing protein n=1 Tax=Colletotrichum sojae TaxID=2175907 RepID=A0A8H6JBE2_9PEZI|nr:hypothetical protein CSOJ01_06649 [Colletotrichum sojae]